MSGDVAGSGRPIRAPSRPGRPMSGARASASRLRGQLVAFWFTGSPSRRAAIVLGGTIAAALAGAFLFGAWHVLFGGLVKGNWRAGAFGLTLAAVCALLLGAGAALLRRRLRG